MAYNISNFVNNSNTTLQIIENINTESGGFFAIGLLILIFIMVFIALKFYETRVALLSSSMIMTMLSVFFWWAGWIQFSLIFVSVVLLFISLLWNALGD